jgi:hypothetical protein
MKKFMAFSLLLGLALCLHGPTWSQCHSCATELTLKKSDWLCLEGKLEGYLAEIYDPVVVSLFKCDNQASDRLRAPTAPPIAPKKLSASRTTSGSVRVFTLSKSQLNCVIAKMPYIKANARDPVTLSFVGCAP